MIGGGENITAFRGRVVENHRVKRYKKEPSSVWKSFCGYRIQKKVLMYFSAKEILFFVFQRGKDESFQFFSQFGIVLNALFGCIASLSEFGIVVAVP